MAFNPTPEQRTAIEGKGTILVSAAAGSGKTAVLVERVINHLTNSQKPIDADRLLIVTFTNAAAAEMRARIEKRLNEEINKNPGNPKLLRQQLLMSKAVISTIDSFCIELVRDNFQHLSIQPDFKIADPSAMEPLKEKAITEVFENHYNQNDPGFFALLDAVGSDYGDNVLKDFVLKIYDSSRAMPFPEKWFEKIEGMYKNISDLNETYWAEILFDYAKHMVKTAADDARNVLNKMSRNEKIFNAYGAAFCAIIDQLNMLYEKLENKDWDGAYDFIESFDIPAFKPLRNFDDERLKSSASMVKNSIKEMVKKDLKKLFLTGSQTQLERLTELSPHISKLMELVREFAEQLKTECRSRNVLSFDAVEHLALKLLVEDQDGEIKPTEIAREIAQRYDEVLVDEYQDTNNLQDTLFYALSDNGSKLFLVGDVKQSIYGFRYANPENFMIRKQAYPPYDGKTSPSKILLKNNFRSRGEVCEFINFFFSIFMSRNSGGVDYTHEEMLIPLAQYPESPQPSVELYLLQKGEEDSAELQEARFIADYIQNAVESGMLLQDKKDPEKLRRAEYGDFTILLRTIKGKAAVYFNELRSRGIPVSSSVGGFLDSAEIITMASLLKAIDRPSDDVAVLSVLMSPIFSFTDTEIAEIRVNNTDCNIISSITQAAQNGNAKCAEFLEKLRSFRTLANTLPVGQLIKRLYDITGYAEIVLAAEDGERRRANLLQLISYATEFENSGYKGLSAFIGFLDRLKDSDGLKSAEAVKSQNTVRIMSIHASKGLEFPVCIIANCGMKFNTRDSISQLVLDEFAGIGFKYIDEENGVRKNVISRAIIALLANNRMVSEEMRLLYVAMTRAKEKLVLITTESKPEEKLSNLGLKLERSWADNRLSETFIMSANSYADWILSAALIHPSCSDFRALAGADIIPAETRGLFKAQIINELPECTETRAEIPQMPQVDDQFYQQIKQRLSYTYPYDALNKIAAKSSVSKLVHESDSKQYDFNSRPAFMLKSGLTPAERGTANHKFMQFADYNKAAQDIQAEVERLYEWEYISFEEAQAIDVKSIERFFKSELFKRIKSSNNVKRELRFLTEIPVGEIEPGIPDNIKNEYVVVQGVVDCVFDEDGQLVIVDFKTDRLSEKELIAEYSKQLEIYAKSLSKNYKKLVKECYLYSFYLNRAIPVKWQNQD